MTDPYTFDDDRQIVPEPHRPNVDTLVGDGFEGIVLKEEGNADAWIQCEEGYISIK